MYLHEKARIIFKRNVLKAEDLRRQMEAVKDKMERSTMDGKHPVAIALGRTPELIITMFAMLEMEVPFLPIDMSQPKERLMDMLNQAGVTHVVVGADCAWDFPERELIHYQMDETKECVSVSEKYTRKQYKSETAYVLFTSGTTGKPKGVEVTRKGLKNFIDGIAQVIDFREGKTIISLTAHTFDIFFLESILALSKGMCMVLATEDERKNPRKIEELVVLNQVEMIQMTPSTMQLLYLYDRELKYLKNVKEIMIGGESFPERLLETLQKLTKAKIYNMYGPTETTIWSTVADLTEEKEIHIGKPIKNTKIHLLSDSLQPVQTGETGEICIEGDGLAKGYINNDELTGQAFVYLEEGVRIYKTGDYGVYDTNGRLKCLGRKDSQVKILGHRIELEDIDNNLNQFPEIIDCVTCFLKNERELFITFYKAEKELEKESLIHFLSAKIPEYMIPHEYIKVPEFLYNNNGKLSRKEMLKTYYRASLDEEKLQKKRNLFAKGTNSVFESIEKMIYECLDGLDVEIKKETKLEELPFDSLSYAEMMIGLEEEFQMDFDTECLSKTYFKIIGEIEDYIRVKNDKERGKYTYGK